MGDIYVRGLDEKVKRQLMQEARSKKVSLSKYICILLTDHTQAPAIKAVEDKYAYLAKDMIGLYQSAMDRYNEQLEENTALLLEVRERLKED